MLLSIFTPTNDTEHLHEAYDSLTRQEHSNWEWIIGLNGKATLPQDEAFRDKRIKPFSIQTSGQAGIGALKHACCQRAKGEILIELDHDDMLWPGVLTEIAKQAHEGADFIYSDAAGFDEKERPVWYSADHGWETYPVELYGKTLLATRNFDITPRSLCEVYYAPDHVRCWRRSFYEKIGGHDISLSVGDDHDLICRSYLAGGKFAHTGTVGYVYRHHRGNTVKARSGQIQRQCGINRRKYLHKLIDQWTARHRYYFVDLSKDIEWQEDVPKLNILKDNTVGCVRAYGQLHWVPQEKVPRVMEELHRVLVPGGWLCIRAPSTKGPAAFVPEARSHWNTLTFDYFCDYSKSLVVQPYRGRFQQVQCYEAFIKPKRDRPLNLWRVWADLCAIKGQRQPAPVRI